MSVNSSSASNSSLDSVHYSCINSTVRNLISVAFSITKSLLLLPLCIFILYLGCQRWRQQRSFKSMSHSDMFTYHLAVIELIWGLGIVLYVFGFCFDLPHMKTVGKCIFTINFCGETFFHILTCVERYLAVCHPIIYMGLRNTRGVRIRNISIACVWLLSFVWGCAASQDNLTLSMISFFSFLVLSLAIISFCSLRVLCALIRPGPGERGGDRERVDQSKKRAFFTIMVIMCMLWLWFLGYLVTISLHESRLLNDFVGCMVRISGVWCNLPSSLVLPLLYLHRTNKLSCFHLSNG